MKKTGNQEKKDGRASAGEKRLTGKQRRTLRLGLRKDATLRERAELYLKNKDPEVREEGKELLAFLEKSKRDLAEQKKREQEE